MTAAKRPPARASEPHTPKSARANTSGLSTTRPRPVAIPQRATPRVTSRPVSDATGHLRTLARRLADSYVVHVQPCAILLVGSAATGDADVYSDLDMLVYYDRVPPEAALAETPGELGAERYRCTPWSDESGEPDEQGYSERYSLNGVECQVGHESVSTFEREIRRLVVDLELEEELLKIMSGLFEGLAFYGRELIDGWRHKAAYTEKLQRAMIEKRWRFFPWWYFQERLRARDTTVWRYDVFVQSVYSIVGVLAALNRLYFSTFEFKRASKFLARLEVAPPNLAARLDALFEFDEPASTTELERLVGETGSLVSARFPDIDLTLEWGGHQTPPGSREPAWSLKEREGNP
jgi:nucleotidyltransferase-like protein